MLRDSSSLTKAFQGNIENSLKECKAELEKIQDMSYSLTYCFSTFLNEGTLKELMDSLLFWCYLESMEILGCTAYLSYCGLYRNASENIRHLLERIVQSYYIDINHPKTSFMTKLEILKEIEDKREYHVSRLLQDKLSFRNDVCKGLDCKGFLNTAYKNLSVTIHPSHDKVMAIRKQVMISKEKEGVAYMVDCREVEKIFASMKPVLEVFYVLIVFEYPEFLDVMRKDKDFVACVKKYKLKLLTKLLSKSKSK